MEVVSRYNNQISTRTLANWRSQGVSPPFTKVGGRILYPIDALEEWDVCIIDSPNAFVQTRITNKADKAVMRMRGKLAELLVKVAPKIYTKYVTITNKGKTVLYVKLY